MIRAFWLLPAVIACACNKGVPHVDDPNNIVINGEKMSAIAFIEKYCIGKEGILLVPKYWRQPPEIFWIETPFRTFKEMGTN